MSEKLRPQKVITMKIHHELRRVYNKNVQKRIKQLFALISKDSEETVLNEGGYKLKGYGLISIKGQEHWPVASLKLNYVSKVNYLDVIASRSISYTLFTLGPKNTSTILDVNATGAGFVTQLSAVFMLKEVERRCKAAGVRITDPIRQLESMEVTWRNREGEDNQHKVKKNHTNYNDT